MASESKVEEQTLAGAPEIGSLVAERYRVLEMVGKGGMGVVYRAEHVHIGRNVALKMLLRDLAVEVQAFKRFQQEARAASLLDHPNIVAIYDFGLIGDDQAYLVMDYIAGKSLDCVFAESPDVIVLPRFRHIFAQACDALNHAHEHGVVHRDIKPSNIMLVRKGDDEDFVKIVDFGLVKLMSLSDPDQKLTSSQTLVGSPLYMSPEQCRGLELDHRSDIYSLGCVMYRALTGALPVLGETALDTLYKHVSEEPLPISTANPSVRIPPQLEKAVLKALQKRPEDRQQSMAELRQEIFDAIPSGSQRGTTSTVLMQKVEAPVMVAAPVAASGVRRKKKPSVWFWLAPTLLLSVFSVIVVGSLLLLIEKERDALRDAADKPSVATVETHGSAAPQTPVEQPKQPAPVQTNGGAGSSIPQNPPVKPDSRKFAQAASAQTEGDIAFVAQEWEKARTAYERALQIKETMYGKHSSQLLPAVARLTICCARLHDTDATVSNFNKFGDLFHSEPKPLAGDAHLLAQLAGLSQTFRNEALTEQLVVVALTAKSNGGAPHEPLLTKPLLELARRKAMHGDNETAEQFFKWALSVSAGTPQLNTVARLQLAAFLRSHDRYEEAQQLSPLMSRLGRRRPFDRLQH